MRQFLVLTLALFGGLDWKTAGESISPSLSVDPGAVNRVRLGSGQSTWVYRLPDEGQITPGSLLLTHGRRDVLPPNPRLCEPWKVMAPEAERNLLEDPATYWESFRTKRFHDYEQQSTKVLAEPFPVDRWVKGGDRVEFPGGALEVVETPGFTRGAISYVGKVDGQQVGFTGDLIYDGGRILDLYSLQDAIPEAQIRGYHGYAARLADLIDSLNTLKTFGLDLIVPSRGPVIRNPAESIDLLIRRVRQVYHNYLSTNALNWYFKEDRMRVAGRRVLGDEARIDLMSYSTHLETPPWILSQSTSRLIVSDSGYGFLLDCGYQQIIDTVNDWIAQGLVRGIEGLFVTHFHDDHADMVQRASEVFKCPVYALAEYQDVLENPAAYHLPAMTANPVETVVAMNDGKAMRWREFDFTFHYYPGQAFHHGGLFVQKPGEDPIFFIGDSFSPSGMDDYCLLNRNLIHDDEGYFLCLKKLRDISGDYWLINEHIPHIFRFSDVELGYLEQRYRERRDVLRELFPWDDPNYGIDEQWASFYPYGAAMKGGEERWFEVRIENHSPTSREFEIQLHGHGGVKVDATPQRVTVPSRQSGRIKTQVTAPEKAGTYIITADISTNGMAFENWTEAMLVVD